MTRPVLQPYPPAEYWRAVLVTEHQSALADSQNNLGVLYKAKGRMTEALTACQAASAIRERLVWENPTVTQYQANLAGSHKHIGLLYRDIGKTAEALAYYQQTIKIQEQLARVFFCVLNCRDFINSSEDDSIFAARCFPQNCCCRLGVLRRVVLHCRVDRRMPHQFSQDSQHHAT